MNNPNINIRLEEFSLKVSVDGLGKDYQYAFYLYNGYKKVDTIWYGDDNFTQFDIEFQPGILSVVCFIRECGSLESEIFKSKKIANFSLPRNYHISEGGLAEVLKKSSRFNVLTSNYNFPIYSNIQTFTKKSERLYIMLTAAVKPSDDLPVFNRLMWQDDFPGYFVAISDPSLLKIQKQSGGLGWYLGCADHPMIFELAILIRQIATLLSVDFSNVYVYGSSGAGFAAIKIASAIDSLACAIAINSRVDVLQAQTKALDAFCMSNEISSITQLEENYGDLLTVIPEVKSRSCRALIIQNTNDKYYYESQFKSLSEITGMPVHDINEEINLTCRMKLITYNGPEGHVGEDRKMLGRILTISDKLK